MMSIILTFPGQGSQTVGMGLDFYQNFSSARNVFEEVDEALGQKLSALIFEGPSDLLQLTENTQPALMAVSIAILRTLEAELGEPILPYISFMAGHSLGEYTAYCATKTFTLTETARLLKHRGTAMQQAVPVGQGAMAAILGLEMEQVEVLAQEVTLSPQDMCVIANDNSPGQIVVSGHKTAIDRIVALAPQKGAKRALILPVSAPFHSPLMQPAALAMRDALENTPKRNAIIPVISNVTTQPLTQAQAIHDSLVEQVTHRVRWRESMVTLKEKSVTHVGEIGAGKVLTGLIKRIDPDLTALSISTVQDVDNFLTLLTSVRKLQAS